MNSPIRILATISLMLALTTGGTVPARAQPSVPTLAQRTSAMPLFAVIYRAGPAWKAGAPMKDQNLRDHFFYLRHLSEKGAVIVAGPLGGDGGLVVLRASDQKAASKIVSADPAVLAGVFVGEAKPFLPRIGGDEPLLSADSVAK